MIILEKFKTISINFLIILLTLTILYAITFVILNFFGEGDEYNKRREIKAKAAEDLQKKICESTNMGQKCTVTEPATQSVQAVCPSNQTLVKDTRRVSKGENDGNDDVEVQIDKIHTLIIVDKDGKHQETIRFRESDYQRALDEINFIEPDD